VRERESGEVERSARLGERFQGTRRIAGGEQRLRPGGAGFAGRGCRQVGEQPECHRGVAGNARLPEPQPRVDGRQAGRPRRGIGGRRGVPSARGFPGESLADREQGGPGTARPRPGGGVMTGRRRPEAEPRLRLRQNREGAAVAIVLERAIVATGVELGLGTFHDERGVEPGLAGRRREQRLRRVPRPARESERFGALGRDIGRGLLSRGDGPRRRRRDQKQQTDRPLHCRRRC